MTLVQRLCVGAAALVFAASSAASAAADAPRPLTPADASAYSQAFAAADAGDFVGAQITATEIKDPSLLGYLSFRQLMHPTAHKASFEELASWLGRFRDLPVAEKIFSLAGKRKPEQAAMLPVPEVLGGDGLRSEVTRPAREAFYSGDVRTAYQLAVKVGERWIAGLSAYRLKDYPQAQAYFSQLAEDEAEDPWMRSAGAFWAARSATALGDSSTARTYLRLAAQSPQTFYGMIADRQVALQQVHAPTGQLLLASYKTPPQPTDLKTFTAQTPRAHRAAALAQVGRYEEARQELRAGLALARTAEERKNWTALMGALPVQGASRAQGPRYTILGDYQTPALEPKNGFTIDKALVYAIVRQESAFNPQAVSPVGAIGLMQLMPESAARAMGDDKLKRDPKPLFDPAINLRAGQDYLAWLMERGVGYDLLKVVAAYNGGPGAVLKTNQMLGHDADVLLTIECLPALETRNYVEKVMAAYWSYKRMWGEETKTLDALASGARSVDARLDLADPNRTQPQLGAQTLQIGALKSDTAVSLD